MSTYEDIRLAARFSALAPEPLPGNWDDVLYRANWGDVLDRAGATPKGRRRLDRSRAHTGRRRRLLVALVAIVLLAAAATAAWGIVRGLILDRGFVGLPPVGASSSAPQRGQLVLSFYGRSATLAFPGVGFTTRGGYRIGPMTAVYVYADGRLIWEREGGAPAGANKMTSGFLEQRLTPEGVELLRSTALSTGLFARDVDLVTTAEGDEGGFRGAVRARTGDRLVRVRWMQHHDLRDVPPFFDAHDLTAASPEQERALEQVDRLLTHPAASLPASAWQDPTVRAYVASEYAVCWGHRRDQVNDPLGRRPVLQPSAVLNLLPQAAQDVLRRYSFVPHGSIPPQDCAVVSTEDARVLAQALADGGLEKGVVGNGIDASLGGLTYRLKAPRGRPGHIYVEYEPALPHGEWICTPCG